MTGNDGEHDSQMPADAVHWRGSLRTRIALWSGLITLLLLLLVTVATAWFVRQLILDGAQRDTRASAHDAAERLERTLNTVTITAHGLADLVTSARLDPEQLSASLRALLQATPGANGGLLALEPERPGDVAFVRYIAVNGNDRDFVADGYDYHAQAWYRRTLAATNGWWSEPYLNETAGRVWMVTYNLPLRADGDGAARGMVSLDLPLDALIESIETLAYLPGWRVTLVAPAGTVAMSTVPDVALRQTLDGYIREAGRADLRQAAEAVRMRRPVHYVHTDESNGEKRHTVIEPIADSGWSLLVTQSYAPVIARLNQAQYLLLTVGALLALVSTLLVRRLAKQVSLPVEQLAASAAQLGRGHYHTPIAHTGRHDEVGLMARTLEHARDSIRRQLAEIEEMSAARQKLESELSIARDIQQAMLPMGKVIGHGRTQLEAQAVLEPAKAVGGDFYNFIERGDGELWFVIGDVSDKGVPAALFMARTVTVLEVASQAADSPAQALAEASRRLVQGNDTCMFATVLCGRIDVRNGDCVLASAGHDPPVLLHADGRAEMLELDNGPPLGFEICEDFPLWRGRLHPGASLLAYTDGVTEAFNLDNEAYGSERLLAVIRPSHSALDNCQRLIAEVHGFAGSAPQSDDITVLAISLSHEPIPVPLAEPGATPC